LNLFPDLFMIGGPALFIAIGPGASLLQPNPQKIRYVLYFLQIHNSPHFFGRVRKGMVSAP